MTAYDSRFGQVAGLPGRLQRIIANLKLPTGGPFIGLGPLSDLEAILRLLTLPEFGEWLRTQTDDDLQRWGVEVLDAAEAQADHEELLDDIDEALTVQEGEAYSDVVKRAAEQAATLERVRDVLVETGALAADDTATDPADLVRALLS